MRICTKCKATSENDSAMFCRSCGSEMADDVVAIKRGTDEGRKIAIVLACGVGLTLILGIAAELSTNNTPTTSQSQSVQSNSSDGYNGNATADVPIITQPPTPATSEPANPKMQDDPFKVYFYDTYGQIGDNPMIMWGDLNWEGWHDVACSLVKEVEDGWYSYKMPSAVLTDSYNAIIFYNGLPDSDPDCIQWMWQINSGNAYDRYFIADNTNPINAPESFFYGTQRNASQFSTKEAAEVALASLWYSGGNGLGTTVPVTPASTPDRSPISGNFSGEFLTGDTYEMPVAEGWTLTTSALYPSLAVAVAPDSITSVNITTQSLPPDARGNVFEQEGFELNITEKPGTPVRQDYTTVGGRKGYVIEYTAVFYHVLQYYVVYDDVIHVITFGSNYADYWDDVEAMIAAFRFK